MRIAVGTSGYAYKEWKGVFYPADLKPDGFLSFYASQLRAVEINATFYRMPTEKTLLGWAGQVGDGFCFVLKAPQTITHRKRLKDCAEDWTYFMQTASCLGPKLGPTLVQLPPNMKLDLPRLREFAALIPRTWRVAFEFRHASWFDDAVYQTLREHHAALCLADTDPAESELRVPPVSTADWGYLRLRKVSYSEAELRQWADYVQDQQWKDAFVFFKHEDAGTGPRLAAQFERMTEA